MAAEDESIAAELEEQRASIESRLADAGGGAPVRRPTTTPATPWSR